MWQIKRDHRKFQNFFRHALTNERVCPDEVIALRSYRSDNGYQRETALCVTGFPFANATRSEVEAAGAPNELDYSAQLPLIGWPAKSPSA